jgi:hypothetical protein
MGDPEGDREAVTCSCGSVFTVPGDEPIDAEGLRRILDHDRTHTRRSERDRIRRVLLGCRECGDIHYERKGPDGPTWKHPWDGHNYKPRWRDAAGKGPHAVADLLEEDR